MRNFLVIVTSGSLAWLSPANGAQAQLSKTQGAHVISMGGAVRPAATAELATVAHEPPANEQATTPFVRFRIHEFSKLAVQFEIADDMVKSPSALERQSPEKALPPIAVSPSRTGERASAASFVDIPFWMQATTPVPCADHPYRPAGFLTWRAELRRASHYAMMRQIACEYELPVALFDALIIRESGYQPDARSHKQAFGLTQLMPATAAMLGVRRYSVTSNLRGGAKYLRQQLDTFGHVHLALAAYNSGPARIRNGRMPAITETRNYVANVMANWARLTASELSRTSVSPHLVIPLAPRDEQVERRGEILLF